MLYEQIGRKHRVLKKLLPTGVALLILSTFSTTMTAQQSAKRPGSSVVINHESSNLVVILLMVSIIPTRVAIFSQSSASNGEEQVRASVRKIVPATRSTSRTIWRRNSRKVTRCWLFKEYSIERLGCPWVVQENISAK